MRLIATPFTDVGRGIIIATCIPKQYMRSGATNIDLITKCLYQSAIVKGTQIPQGGVTLTASVLRSATAVKTKVNNQIEIFAIVNGQATISL